MNPRLRKLVGIVAIMIFLVAYAAVAVLVADHLPDHRAVDLVYFAIVGVAWGIPLFPLLAWMNRGPASNRKGPPLGDPS